MKEKVLNVSKLREFVLRNKVKWRVSVLLAYNFLSLNNSCAQIKWMVYTRKGKFTVGSEARQKSWKCGKNGKVV